MCIRDSYTSDVAIANPGAEELTLEFYLNGPTFQIKVPPRSTRRVNSAEVLSLAGLPDGTYPTRVRVVSPVNAVVPMTLFVQSFDAQGGSSLRLRVLDAGAIGSWLDTALDLHPDSGYPLLLAARVYAEAMQPADARGMLERVHRRYLEAPATRWAWEAHAVYVALSLIHISEPRDRTRSRMPSSA